MIIFILLCFINISCLQAASLDGRTTPTYIDTQMTSFASGNSARGWVYFRKGFKVPTGGTLTLELNVPVKGDIDLNGGRLILEKDLWLASGARITGSGLIEGINGNTVPDLPLFGHDIYRSIHLTSSLYITSTISFELPDKANHIIINGHDNVLTISESGGSINLGGNSSTFTTTIRFLNVRLQGAHTHDPTGAAMFTETGSLRNGLRSTILFENTTIDFKGTFSLRATTSILGDVNFMASRQRGPHQIIKTGGKITVDKQALLILGPDKNCVFELEVGEFTFPTKSSSVRLQGCQLKSKVNGLICLNPSRIFLEDRVSVAVPGGDVVIGEGPSAGFFDDTDLFLLGATSLDIVGDTRLVYNSNL
ncbi:MAG: hypothetical protein H6679_03820 [Epsilonproteobacteria bacterium]|nr:hypothetical protein [Campylobacterota bacterium]